MSLPKLAVIILNWNGKETMKEFLPSVVTHTSGSEVEVVVADNGSDDGSVEWLEKEYPDVRVISFDRNYGFAEGYNKAVTLVENPFVLLLNSDVAVNDGWWQPLLSFMEKTPKAGAAQPKIRAYRNPDYFEHAGAAGGLLDSLGYPYCRGRIFGKVEKDEGQFDAEGAVRIAWASGAAIILRREAFMQAGGFDAAFFAHMEEIDLCWRLIRLGYEIYAVPDSEVFHLGGGALPYGNPRKTYLNFRNNLLMLHKNLPPKRGRKILFLRRSADTLAFLMFLLKGKWGDAKAVLKAHSDFRRMRKNYPPETLPSEDTLSLLPGTDKSILSPFNI